MLEPVLHSFKNCSYYFSFQMRYFTEMLRIQILIMIEYGDRERTHMEVVHLFRVGTSYFPGNYTIEIQFQEYDCVKLLSTSTTLVGDHIKIDF